MALALLVVTAAQMLDLGTFVRMILTHGPATEVNPFVSGLLVQQGLTFVAVAKLAGLSLVVAVIVVLAQDESHVWNRRLAAGVTTFAVVAGIVGGWSNALVLL